MRIAALCIPSSRSNQKRSAQSGGISKEPQEISHLHPERVAEARALAAALAVHEADEARRERMLGLQRAADALAVVRAAVDEHLRYRREIGGDRSGDRD